MPKGSSPFGLHEHRCLLAASERDQHVGNKVRSVELGDIVLDVRLVLVDEEVGHGHRPQLEAVLENERRGRAIISTAMPFFKHISAQRRRYIATVNGNHRCCRLARERQMDESLGYVLCRYLAAKEIA